MLIFSGAALGAGKCFSGVFVLFFASRLPSSLFIVVWCFFLFSVFWFSCFACLVFSVLFVFGFV